MGVEEDKKAIEAAKALLEKNGMSVSSAASPLTNDQLVYITNTQVFDGSLDWKDFKEHFERRIKLISPNEAVKSDIIINVLSPEVFSELKRHVGEENMDSITYDKVDEAMMEMYSKRPHMWESRRKFMSIEMEASETVAQFYNRLKNVAGDCSFGVDTDKLVKYKLVTGLRNPIYKKVMDNEDVDLKKTLELCQSAELKVSNKPTTSTAYQVQPGPSHGYRSSYQARPDAAPKREYSPSAFNRLGPYRKRKQCWRCAYDDHVPPNCPFQKFKCGFCRKVGHIVRACSKQKKAVKRLEEQQYVDEPPSEDTEMVKEVEDRGVSDAEPIFIKIKLQKKKFALELDTGSRYNLMTEGTWSKEFCSAKIQPTSIKLKSFTENKCVVKGEINLFVEYQNKVKPQRFVIVQNGACTLLGREFMKDFDLGVVQVNSVKMVKPKVVEQLFTKYEKVFSSKLGCFQGVSITVETTPDIKPIFRKPREVPFAYRKEVEAHLDKLEAEGILERMDHCDYGTPLVVVKKKDGGVRVCGDYKSTINRYLKDFNFPIPKPINVFIKLAGCEVFFQLDLTDAYTQMPLDDASAKLCAWSTTKGAYKVKRMPFGIKPASGIFQCEIEKRLGHVAGVVVFIDDIYGGGKTEEEMYKVLEEVLKILEKAGLTVKMKKVKIGLPEIDVLGHVVNKNGIKKDPKKVAGISGIERPKSVKEVQAFCGMVNYYKAFLPSVADTMRPLYHLLKKEVKFDWTQECETAFKKVKDEIAKDVTLAHYDLQDKIILVTDASDFAISAVLLSVKKSEERPIAFWGRMLNKAEKNYSVVDKEALGVVEGCKQFRQYLLGRKFTLRTDQKSLIKIFGEHQGIPIMTSARLTRYGIILAGYDYEIQHVKSKENVADPLSRLRTSEPVPAVKEANEVVCALKETGVPFNERDLRRSTADDVELSQVMETLKENRADWKNRPTPFAIRKDELSIEKEILFWKHRAVIPKSMRQYVLDELHCGHMGVVKMKAVARQRFWWPSIDRDIEEITKRCGKCLGQRDDPGKSPLIPWPMPAKVWERLHMDYMDLQGLQTLVLVDALSKWVEAFVGVTATTEFTVQCMRQAFARFGIPGSIVTDNASCFTSGAFKKFIQANGIAHATIAPGHPSTNGQAENMVKTLKKAMKKKLGEGRKSKAEIETSLQDVLFEYRNTPHRTTGAAPAEMMLGRKLSDILEKLCPIKTVPPSEKFEAIKNRIQVQQEVQKKNYGGVRSKTFKCGDLVMVRDFTNPNRQGWVTARVKEKLGERHYICELGNGRERKCNVEQMVDRRSSEQSFDGRRSQLTGPTSGRSTLTDTETQSNGRNAQSNSRQTTSPPEAKNKAEPRPRRKCVTIVVPVARQVNNEAEGEPSVVEIYSSDSYDTADPIEPVNSELQTEKTPADSSASNPNEPCPLCEGSHRETNMVECTGCLKWVHYECAGVGDSVAADDTWKCANCLGVTFGDFEETFEDFEKRLSTTERSTPEQKGGK